MNIELDFRNAMAAAGIETDAPISADGNLHRVHVEGDKPGTKNGWYVLHACSFPAGAFGCNKRGISDKWRSQVGVPFTPTQRADMAEQQAARAAQRDEAYAKAAKRAASLLLAAKHDASGHAYCARKQISPFGVKANSQGLLVIPIYDARDGSLQSLQTIAPDGTKRMLAGGRLAYGLYPLAATDSFWEVTKISIGIAEGFATAATLADVLGETRAIYAAFSANNLKNVATALRRQFPQADIVLFGDNDGNGVGQRYATEAATAVNGRTVIPPVAGQDWNDYAVKELA